MMDVTIHKSRDVIKNLSTPQHIDFFTPSTTLARS